MHRDEFRFGFRILGNLSNERRLVDANVALDGYAHCVPKAKIDEESYLSASCFADEFQTHLASYATVRGFEGKTFARWILFDIDRDDIDSAISDTRKLVALILERFSIDGESLLVFFSGRKGFHVGIPTSLWGPSPSNRFHRYCRAFAELLANECQVTIDSGVYDRVLAFRAPNSKHPKTGLHKRRLSVDELFYLRTNRITELAKQPLEFGIPEPLPPNRNAINAWRDAMSGVDAQIDASSSRRSGAMLGGSSAINGGTLNRSTVAFIREGATTGDRHRLLFSAAANLSEFGCNDALAWALLSEPALDSGLAPNEVRRQIQCGLAYRGGGL